MKEKIWKLLELLNEYSKNIWYFNEEDLQWQTKAWILSKEFWWVKWLVENDKIDIDHLEYKYQDIMYELLEALIIENKSDFLIMLLSIQDNPINFLISILK